MDIVAMINASNGSYVDNPEPITGGSITFYIEQKDGNKLVISNEGNVYLRINIDTYKANSRNLVSHPVAYRECMEIYTL